MDSSNEKALRDELQAAIDSIDVQMRGLRVLAKIVVTPGGNVAVSTQMAIRTRRRDLISAVLAALNSRDAAKDDLVADGYPGMPQAEVTTGVFEEVQEAENDLVVASEIFGAKSSSTQDQATIDKIDAGMKANQASINQAMQP